MAKSGNRLAITFIFITMLIDAIGFGLIIPVLPSLIKDLTGLEGAQAVAWGGFLSLTFAVTNFLAGPLLGNLSDRFGRRPILLASLGMLCVDYIIMGFAHAIWVLFIGRLLAGVFSATYSTANAYIADITTPEERGKAFGMIGAAFGVGFILGPFIGGELGAFDERVPFFAAAALAGLNCLFGLFVLPESLKVEDRRAFELKRANPIGTFVHFSKMPQLAWLFGAVFLIQLAHWVYPATWNFHADIRYGWDPQFIGRSLMIYGLCSAIVQAGLMGIVLKKFGPERTVTLGLTINIIAFVGYAFAFEGWMLLALTPFAALGAIASPAMNSLMSTRIDKSSQGELQGANSSLMSLASIIATLAMTQTLSFFSSEGAPIYFPGAAFMLAAILTTLAVIPYLKGLRAPAIANND